jgi:hypothetical protein
LAIELQMRWLLKRKQGSVRICKAIKLAIYFKKVL